MEKQAGKIRENDDGSGSGSGSDRISQLPESMLHRILCLLSLKKAVQTSLLSKSWRHLGSTRPIIYLRRICNYDCPNKICENCFEGNGEMFLSVLEDTFQRYHHQNISAQKLSLQMSPVDSQSISLLQKWIPILFIKPNAYVNSFRISFAHWWTHFDLPSVVFKVESMRRLYLEGCSLNELKSVHNVVLLKNLRKLCLRYVCIDDETLEKIMSGCPSLEYLGLRHCEGLNAINIANKNIHSLEHFEFTWSSGVSLEMDVSTLESIRILKPIKWCHNHNYYFPCLESLHLTHVQLPTQPFGIFSCNFPRLEELTLLRCCGFEEINISSFFIKRITINPNGSLKKVAIDAPNILYFEFSCNYVPTTLSLTTTNSKEWTSVLNLSHLDAYHDDLSKLHKLIEMLKELSQSQISLNLHYYRFFKIKQIDSGGFIDPIVLEHLGLHIIDIRDSKSLPLLNALFLMFRPRYINTLPVYDKEVHEFLWKGLMIHEREEREHGWQQELEEVSIEASDKKGKVWHRVQWTCLPESSKEQKIRFRLKWRD